MSEMLMSFPVTEAFDFCTHKGIAESSCYCWYVRDMALGYTLEQNQPQLWKTEIAPLPCKVDLLLFFNKSVITGLTHFILSITIQRWESNTKLICI